MTGVTRLDPLTDAEWPEEIGDLRGGFAVGLNVYRTMAHHPKLLRAWAALRSHVVIDTSLGRERSEVVILRCAHRLQAGYEWSHHILRGRAQGIDDRRIRAIGGIDEEMTEGDLVLVRAVDELMDDAALSPDTHAALAAQVGVDGVLDLMATVGFYSTLAFLVKTFDTPVDDDVAKGLADQPL